MKVPARLILSFVVLLISFFSIVPVSHAQSLQGSSQYPTNGANSDRERVFSILNGVMSFTSCQLAGIDLVDRNNLCPGMTTNQQVGGALGFITGTLSSFYTSPASSSEYGRYLAQNFGITKSAYAQEDPQGFRALSPVLKIWNSVRNLTYIIAVVFFILIGFGIMVRFHIDPRTVMTIQNQIPKIIVALVLITFSYSIAGFMVDAMWLITYTGINVLSGAVENGGNDIAGQATRTILTNPLNYTSDLLNTGTDEPTAFGPLKGIRDVSGGVGSFVHANVDDIVLSFLGMDKNADCNNWYDKIIPFVGSPVECGIKAGIAWFIGVLLHAAIALVIFFAIFIALIRVWIMLLKCYVYIIIYTILGPFWILLGLLPESRFGFTNWMRAFTARLMVFPATALLLLAARIFIDGSVAIQSAGNGGNQIDFVPPLIGNPNIMEGGGLGYLIAFGIIMLAPEMLQIMMDAMKTQPFKYTPAITGGFARGAAVPAALAGGIINAGFKKNAQGMPGVIPFAIRSAWTRRNQNRNPNTRVTRARNAVANTRFGRGLGRVQNAWGNMQQGRRTAAAQNNPYYWAQQQNQPGGNQGGGQGQNQGGGNP